MTMTMTSPSAAAGDAAVRTPSLRRRMVLSVLGLLLIVLTALGLIMNWVLGTQLRADVQQRLLDRAQFAQVLTTQNLPAQTVVDQLAGQGITAQFTTGQQTLIGRDNPTPPPPPGKGGHKPPPPAGPAIPVQHSGDQLSTQLNIQGGTLVLQASQAGVDQTLNTLSHIELAAGAATVLLTGLLLIRVVHTALGPLDRMTALADRIRNGTRGRRLHPTTPRTELGRTAVAFDGMLDALESAEADAHQAEDRMRQFLADASHDLRTPLAGVIGNAELLLRANPDRAERETRLVDLVREAQRAARLVDDLLLITRLDTPQPTLRREPVALTDVADRAITLARLRRPDRTSPSAPRTPRCPATPTTCNAPWPTCWTTPPPPPHPAATSPSPSPPPPVKYASPSPTPDPASVRPTDTASSTASSACPPPAPERAPASGCPSPAPSPPPTAASCTTYPPHPGHASTSPCPPPPSHQPPPPQGRTESPRCCPPGEPRTRKTQ